MPMTATEKVLALHSGKETVTAGEWIIAKIDLALATDVSAALCIEVFERIGAADVPDRERVILVNDHFVPAKDIASATRARVNSSRDLIRLRSALPNREMEPRVFLFGTKVPNAGSLRVDLQEVVVPDLLDFRQFEDRKCEVDRISEEGTAEGFCDNRDDPRSL